MAGPLGASKGAPSTAVKTGAPTPPAIPSSPMVEMARIKFGKSQEAHKEMQAAIDYLTAKGKKGVAFTDDEKEFLVDLFEAMSLGGWLSRMAPEAAALADNYITKPGASGKKGVFEIDSDVYETSVIVHDAAEAMKELIAADVQGHPTRPVVVTSKDPRLAKLKGWAALGRGKRNQDKQGCILTGGLLLAEQHNKRLKNANNRFVLSSESQKGDGGAIATKWFVDDEWRYEPFSKGFVSDLPTSDDPALKLKLPDGLCHYMTVLGIAWEFDHHAEWREAWTPGQSKPPAKPDQKSAKGAVHSKAKPRPRRRR